MGAYDDVGSCRRLQEMAKSEARALALCLLLFLCLLVEEMKVFLKSEFQRILEHWRWYVQTPGQKVICVHLAKGDKIKDEDAD